MINKTQLRELISDTLKSADLYSEAAVNLLMGTAAQESHLGTYIEQIKGPAKGIFQMEPATEKDIWKNYLKYNPILANKITKISGVNCPNPNQLEADLAYQILMCRIHYRRDKYALPEMNDIYSMAKYWKRVYNTVLGKGTVKEFVLNYEKYVL